MMSEEEFMKLIISNNDEKEEMKESFKNAINKLENDLKDKKREKMSI